jgi:hypothetical protein
VASCIRPAKAHGLCGAHYNRLRKTGNIKPEMPVRSLLRRRLAHKVATSLPNRQNAAF